MKKLMILCATLLVAGACNEAEVPLYDKQEQAINFWIPPTPGVNVVYPDALRIKYTFDTGSFANFVAKGLAAFSRKVDPIAAEAGVEIMGFAPAGDMAVRIKIDPLSSDGAIAATLADDYKIAAGKGTAILPVKLDVGALAVGQTAQVVLKFDYDNMDFGRGVGQRDSVTMVCGNVDNGSPRIPVATSGFGLSAMNLMFWEWGMDLATTYGTIGLNKMLFMCVVLETTNLGTLNPYNTDQCAANNALLKEKLAAYKALNAEDPANYPPLYQSGETWISFP